MIHLQARSATRWDAEPFVARVSTNPLRPEALRACEALFCKDGLKTPSTGFCLYLHAPGQALAGADTLPAMELPESLLYLSDGDIIRVVPKTGDVSVLYRLTAPSNVIFLTNRCNSNCIMCPQPSTTVDDGYLAEAYLQAIPLMCPNTAELIINGGEPTLHSEGLLRIVQACRNYLPNIAVHLLSNGRMFNYMTLCLDLAQLKHPDLMVGIPLHSDSPSLHNFVAQTERAFDQTIRGIMNLRRCGLRIEIRVVLFRQTVNRLPQLAKFICRNLPFVEHVALMGMEAMGRAKANLDSLWVDPVDYQTQLVTAVRELVANRMNVSIFNHQLCTLDKGLWPFAKKSISDWKNEYVQECQDCTVRPQCGGFFSSAMIRHSAHIQAVRT